MESFSLATFTILPFLFLALVAGENGDELNTFIVHVQAPENLEFSAPEDRTTWYKSFLPDDGRLVHAYTNVVSGFSARLTQEELDAVSAMPGFLFAVPDRVYTVLTTHTPQFLGLNVQHGAWNPSGSGAGVIIGVLDTGVFPNHPSFRGEGMPSPPAKWKGRCEFNGYVCNNKLIGARAFLAGSNAMKGSSTSDALVPPTDDEGHGTHTASTAAGAVVPGAQVLGQARGIATGMAPRAHVAIYKVCGEVDCAASDILAGIDAAVADGCDIISMSLGGRSVPFHEDSIAIGTFGAIEKGVFVSLAAGNSGPNVSSLSNEAPWMLTVAASTMDRSIRATVRLGNGLSFDGESVYQPEVSPAVLYPLVYAGASGKPFAQFCGNGSLDGFDVRGKIVLCERGDDIARIDKGAVVQKAGGVGMILMNQFPDGYSTIADTHVLPASHVGYTAGAAIKSYINYTAHPVAQILFKGTVIGTSPAPAIVSFSSRGPSLQNPGILKPDITGPGVSVLAAWPFKVGPATAPTYGPTFNIISGTSMSTPHLSGIAALIKSKYPNWSPAAIKSAIMTTADVTDRSGNPILNEQRVPANFFATGAGHVNPMNATNPGLVYDTAPADYIGYLCGLYTSQQVSVIARRPINCSAVRVFPERLLNYPSISVTFPPTWKPTVPTLVGRTVKNVGEVPAVYHAEVDMPDDVVHVEVIPKMLQITEANQEMSFTVFVFPKQGSTRVVQGALRWVSAKYTVRSPISVTFAAGY